MEHAPPPRGQRVSEAPSQTVSPRSQAQRLVDLTKEAKAWKKLYYVGPDWTAPSTNDERPTEPGGHDVLLESLADELEFREKKFFASLSQLTGDYYFGVENGLYEGDKNQTKEDTQRLVLELFAEHDTAPTVSEAYNITKEPGSAFGKLKTSLGDVYDKYHVRTGRTMPAAATESASRMAGEPEGGNGG
jgi:hypothetical protein